MVLRDYPRAEAHKAHGPRQGAFLSGAASLPAEVDRVRCVVWQRREAAAGDCRPVRWTEQRRPECDSQDAGTPWMEPCSDRPSESRADRDWIHPEDQTRPPAQLRSVRDHMAASGRMRRKAPRADGNDPVASVAKNANGSSPVNYGSSPVNYQMQKNGQILTAVVHRRTNQSTFGPFGSSPVNTFIHIYQGRSPQLLLLLLLLLFQLLLEGFGCERRKSSARNPWVTGLER